VGSIGKARVISIKPYGVFVEYEGCTTHGLVHISQLRRERVEAAEDVVKVGDTVRVKVLPGEAGRLSLTMKSVDQATGADLGGDDPPRRRRNEDEDVSQMTWGTEEQRNQLTALEREPEAPAEPKVKANFEATGALAAESNTVNGAQLKWAEPPDAQKPTRKWRLYQFKGKESLEPYHIHRQSGYLLGRDRRVADIPLDHPSCSSQHAVLQFRMTSKNERVDGEMRTTKLVRPYIMDLGSTNGSFVNGERVEAQRYIELLAKDVLRFGYSSREYVMLNADSEA